MVTKNVYISEKNDQKLADSSKNKGKLNTMKINCKRKIYFEP